MRCQRKDGKFDLKCLQEQLLEKSQIPNMYKEFYRLRDDTITNLFDHTTSFLNDPSLSEEELLEFLSKHPETLREKNYIYYEDCENLLELIKAVARNYYLEKMNEEMGSMVEYTLYQYLIDKGYDTISIAYLESIKYIAENVEPDSIIMEFIKEMDKEIGMDLEIDAITEDVLKWR